MIVNIRLTGVSLRFVLSQRWTNQVDPCFMGHESNDGLIFTSRSSTVDQSSTSIGIVAPQAIDECLDRVQGPLMENELARKNVHC